MDGKGKIYDIDGLVDWFPTGQICRSGEALAEWRSCEQVDNGTPSTSPPFWETDDDSDDEFKPSELYGKFTWKIEKFSQLSKKELKSEVFEVHGYKWYILIYPQGCDVCNHLSLFLCVANHTQLLPGWGHFAQFTLAVVNKDRKKTKYSDTLHRFCKKEHDWGWKKFIELSKVQDGFLIDDTLKIKAQVQIIRKKVNRPFRCLDRQYRRELLGVYLSHVEQVCRKFVEDQKSKLRKLLKDKARWSSFCTFWSGMDPSTKQQMSRERAEVLFKVVVKHFFIEKEVTSALVMDSLYSGLKALQMKSKCRGGKENVLESATATYSRPIVFVDGDMFVLADDLLSLLEKSPRQSVASKDVEESSGQSKAGSSGQDLNKDSVEWEERRLTEFGRRTIEIFVLSHIFSHKIEVAYQEAVAARIQEELIREEEEAREAELEQKVKRQAADKEKRLKKKMNKQKRIRNGKGPRNDEKGNLITVDHANYNHISEKAMGLSGKSMLHSAEMFDQCDVPDLRDDDDAASVWLTAEDIDGSPVTEDSAISDTCLSGESSTTEQGFLCLNESMSSTLVDGVHPLELNGWCEHIVSDNGSWNVSVRKKSQRHKVTTEQISQTAEASSELGAIANDLGRGNTRSSDCQSTEHEHTSDGLLKDQAQKLPYAEKIEHRISQEGIEGSSKQITVLEASHVQVLSNDLSSNVIPEVRRNGILIQNQFRTEVSTLQAISESSSKKHNVDIPRHRIEKDNLRPVSKLSSKPLLDQVYLNSRPSSISRVGSARKTEAATITTFQPGHSQHLAIRAASSSAVSQLHDDLNLLKAPTVSGPSLLPASNGSVSDSSVQRSQTPPIVLPLDNSANDLVIGLTFGSLTPEVLLGQPQLNEASATGSPKVLAQLIDSPNRDQSGPTSRGFGLAAGSIGELQASTTPNQPPRAPLDDFPHIDIINYLFDEDSVNGQALDTPYSGVLPYGSAANGGMYELPRFSYSPRFESFSSSSDSKYAHGLHDDMQVEFPIHANGHVDDAQ
uniref:MATH domain-containing protein n=1 Tax=Kalanchoe fedtschenkoi TaxID=63787 RepID=A0A7N0V073_KALFE